MPSNKRPMKIIRLNYWRNDPDLAAYLAIVGKPSEVRLGVSPDKFLAVSESGISLSPGLSKQVNIQGLSGNIRYAGMIQDLPFPMSLIPVTLITPLPKQVINPPLKGVMSTVRDLTAAASMLTGITNAPV